MIDTSPDDEENIIIALEHADRVGYLGLHLTDSLLGKLATLIQKPFPALTHLTIISESIDGHTLVLPHQDVVVFVSEFAGFLGVSLVTV